MFGQTLKVERTENVPSSFNLFCTNLKASHNKQTGVTGEKLNEGILKSKST